MLRLLPLLLLLPLQDPDRKTLIRQLGDRDPVVREKATQALEALGDAALPDLRQAATGDDPEIRTRAGILIDLREQELRFAALKEAQRPDKVRLAAPPEGPTGDTAATDGVRFRFQRRPWSPDGTVLGTIFETGITTAPGLTAEWSVAAVRNGADLPLETCAWHSPARVYVPGPVPGEAQVHVKGLRRWYCDVPLVLNNPVDGQTRRFAGYTVTVDWPEIRVRAGRLLDQDVADRMLRNEDVRCTIRPEWKSRVLGGFSRSRSFSRCGTSVVQNRAWCGCLKEPSRETPEPEPQTRETTACDPTALRYGIEAIQSISLTLHLPVEETFEVRSPPLK